MTDDERRKLLHFAIVGGGPTGIEYAAELHDLIYEDLAKLYPQLIQFVKISVYDVAPKVLPMFDQNLANYAMKMFQKSGIEVLTQHHLERIRVADGDLGKVHGGLSIKIKEYPQEVGAGMVVWSTGLMQNPFVHKIAGKKFSLASKEHDHYENDSPAKKEPLRHLVTDPRTGSIMVDPFLRARTALSDPSATGTNGNGNGKGSTLKDVFVLGDCSMIESGPHKSLPKTAQVASQQALYLAKQLNRCSDLSTHKEPFHFRNWGAMTYLGNWKAIHQGPASDLKGAAAWVFWRTAYLTKSMSVRNKILVPVYWFVSWLFGRGISRF